MFAGKYRGPACRACNRALTIRNEVSIWAHNLTNFDGHMVLRSLGRGWDSYKVIPRNSEKVTGIAMSKKLKPLPTAVAVGRYLPRLWIPLAKAHLRNERHVEEVLYFRT